MRIARACADPAWTRSLTGASPLRHLSRLTIAAVRTGEDDAETSEAYIPLIRAAIAEAGKPPEEKSSTYKRDFAGWVFGHDDRAAAEISLVRRETEWYSIP